MVVASNESPSLSLPPCHLPLLHDLHATAEEDGGGSFGKVGLDLSYPPSPHPPSPLDLSFPSARSSLPPLPSLLHLDLRDAAVASVSVSFVAVGLFCCFNKQYSLLH